MPSTGTRSCVAFIYRFHAEALLCLPCDQTAVTSFFSADCFSSMSSSIRPFVRKLKNSFLVRIMWSKKLIPSRVEARINALVVSKSAEEGRHGPHGWLWQQIIPDACSMTGEESTSRGCTKVLLVVPMEITFMLSISLDPFNETQTKRSVGSRTMCFR